MEKKPLIPRKIINVKGKILYNESKQAWSDMKFKKELINEFPQLKEKRSNFTYELMFCRTAEDFNNIIRKFIKTKEIMPMLMFLYKEAE